MAAHHFSIISSLFTIADTILPDKLNVLVIKGIQFEGIILPGDHPLTGQARLLNYKKYPAAVAMTGEIWAIQLESIKMTKSSFGFGKEITWNRHSAILQ